MEQFLSTQNSILIQSLTPSELENMIGRLLDKKLATLAKPNTDIEQKPKDGLYKRKEAARKLKVSLVTLDNWVKIGIVNARRIGTRIYFTEQDINDALKKVLK